MTSIRKQKSSLARNMAWNTAGNLVYCICQWVMTILVVRLDSYGAAGYLSLAMTTSSTFSTIAMFSMRNYQVSDVKGEFKDSEYLSSRVITCVIAIVLCAVYSIGSTSMYQMLCINAFMLIRLAESIVDVFHGINQKYERYDLIGKSYFIRGIATDIAFVSGFFMAHDVFFAILLTGIINLLLVFIYDYHQTNNLEKLSANFNDKHIIVLLKKCIPIVITSFLLSMIPLIAKATVQTVLGNDILGIYSSIASPTLVVQVFATYAFNPLIPRISVLYKENRFSEFSNYFIKILIIFVGFAALICLGSVLLGKIGLTVLYGKEILNSYDIFLPLVLCTLLTAYIWILNSIMTSIRQIIPMMITVGIGFAVCYFASDHFIKSFGANGASYIQIICYGVILIALIAIVEYTIRKRSK